MFDFRDPRINVGEDPGKSKHRTHSGWISDLMYFKIFDYLYFSRLKMFLSKILNSVDHPYITGKGGRKANNGVGSMQVRDTRHIVQYEIIELVAFK